MTGYSNILYSRASVNCKHVHLSWANYIVHTVSWEWITSLHWPWLCFLAASKQSRRSTWWGYDWNEWFLSTTKRPHFSSMPYLSQILYIFTIYSAWLSKTSTLSVTSLFLCLPSELSLPFLPHQYLLMHSLHQLSPAQSTFPAPIELLLLHLLCYLYPGREKEKSKRKKEEREREREEKRVQRGEEKKGKAKESLRETQAER